MFQPLHNLVTVIVDMKVPKKSMIALPDTFEDIFLFGTIQAVGQGRPLENGGTSYIQVKPGDRVMIAQHVQINNQGQRRVQKYPSFEDGGVTVILCDYSEIMGVVEVAPVN